KAPATRRHVAQYIRRLLGYAVYPARLREANPIPKGWLPRVRITKAKECLYPDEDKTLLGCSAVDLERRLAYGVLAREGLRTDELARLRWLDVDLKRGRLALDENKTDDPRDWDLRPDVVHALAAWKRIRKAEDGPEAVEPSAKLFRCSVSRLAAQLRVDLKRAGVTREKLFERSETRQPIRAHDLRATFVTIALATGKTEKWVTDRTGHRSHDMILRYTRKARGWNLGPLEDLDAAIPELAETPAPRHRDGDRDGGATRTASAAGPTTQAGRSSDGGAGAPPASAGEMAKASHVAPAGARPATPTPDQLPFAGPTRDVSGEPDPQPQEIAKSRQLQGNRLAFKIRRGNPSCGFKSHLRYYARSLTKRGPGGIRRPRRSSRGRSAGRCRGRRSGAAAAGHLRPRGSGSRRGRGDCPARTERSRASCSRSPGTSAAPPSRRRRRSRG
ncbi:MAG: tyrosine-type recombinase/integrase, partial [Myxococcales bacterium]|nr:tyrosine-type recombinase/integrase [Myxococcales bacterium]